MKRTILLVGLLALCAPLGAQEEPLPTTLLDARKGFETSLKRKDRQEHPLRDPESDLFSLVKFPTPIGDMGAWLSKPQEPGKKYPAIIWIAGGFPPGGMNWTAWMGVSEVNDQSAKDYRLAGMVMMYPTLRGGYGNPGFQEGFYGEVDDVLAAADYLSKVDYVDPKRIYLGGHSTGGTLVLLVAASTSRFRAVISFGPASDPANYGEDSVPYDVNNEDEVRLRAPIKHLESIRSPTFVIEGNDGNSDSLLALRDATSNEQLHCYVVQEANHFNVLAPANALIAERMAALDKDATLQIDAKELQARCDALLLPRLNAVLEQLEDDRDSLFLRARLHYRQGRVAESEQDYSRLLGKEPEYAPALYNRAMCYTDLGKPKLAVEDYTRYMAVEPTDADAPHYRGRELLKIGRTVEARMDFQLAHELDPDDEHVAELVREYPVLPSPAPAPLPVPSPALGFPWIISGICLIVVALPVAILVLTSLAQRRREAERRYWRGDEPQEDEDGLVDLSGYG